MATVAKLKWDEVGTEAAERMAREGGRRVVWADDGTHGYAAELPDGMTVADALEDFRRAYDPEFSKDEPVQGHLVYGPLGEDE